MKKLFFSALIVALAMTSCGSKTQGTANNDSDSTTEVASADTTAASSEAATSSSESLSPESKTTVENLTSQLQKAISTNDSKAAISTLANLQTIYKNLIEQGKNEEAKKYGEAIKKIINENNDALKSLKSGNTTIADLVNGIKNLPTSANATAEQAKAAVTNDVVNLASPAIAKGKTAITTAEAAAEAIKNAPAAVKAAATNTANKAANQLKTDATNKVNNAVNDLSKAKTEAKAKAKEKAQDQVNKLNQKASDAVNNAANKALKGLGL